MGFTRENIIKLLADNGLKAKNVSVLRWAHFEYEDGRARLVAELSPCGHAYSTNSVGYIEEGLKYGKVFYVEKSSSYGGDYDFGVKIPKMINSIVGATHFGNYSPQYKEVILDLIMQMPHLFVVDQPREVAGGFGLYAAVGSNVSALRKAFDRKYKKAGAEIKCIDEKEMAAIKERLTNARANG